MTPDVTAALDAAKRLRNGVGAVGLLSDALIALVESQKPVEPYAGEGVACDGHDYLPCCHVRATWGSGNRFNFCPNCGRPIKWT